MTKGDIPSPANENLNEKQQQAIQLLLVGQTDQQVADAVGVTRQTVNQWKNQDPVFVARMNREKEELWQSYRQKLRSVVGQAIDVLVGDSLDVENRNLRKTAAVHLLKSVGLYGKDLKPSGPTESQEVERKWRENDQLNSLFANDKQTLDSIKKGLG